MNKYLFENVNKGPYSGKWDKNDVNRKFRYWSEKFGKRIYSHIFRKSFCTNSIHKGMPIAHVAKIVGHADDGRTTARYYYCPMSDQDAKKVYFQFAKKYTINAKANINNLTNNKKV